MMNVAIIGTGFASVHAEMIVGTGRARIQSVTYGSDRDAAGRMAARFDCRNIFTDLASALDLAPDAVVICSPTKHHFEQARAAMEAGCAVVCDKPLAMSLDEAERLAETAKTLNVPGYVYFQWRLHSGVRSLRALIESGNIGALTHIAVRFDHDFLASAGVASPWRHRWSSAGAGAMGDLGIHLIDLLCFLTGEVPHVTASSGRVVFRERQTNDGSPIDCQTEDIAAVSLMFERRACTADLFVSRVSTGRRQMVISMNGTDACVELTINVETGAHEYRLWPDEFNSISSESNGRQFYDYFLDRDVAARSHLSCFDDGVKAQRVFDEVVSRIKS